MPNAFAVNVNDAQLRAEWKQFNATLAGVHELQAQMLERLDQIARSQRRKDPMRIYPVLGGGGSPAVGIAYQLRTAGYRHSRLWLAAGATLSVDLGFGPASIALVAGWNVLDADDSAIIATTTGTPIQVCIELTDEPVQ